ncbi:unnamed protein product [Rhizoctonia solani]|uniref:Laminin domain protein n=1 Tax=Rhizoctonia solani TaxID=456999 RepID=A0A8H3BQB6_9AGAM|nr:unnamed protein product [Rhizoctonia solani]
MCNILAGRVYSPPELPVYLETVSNLKPIVGTPKDEEVIGIHAVIRVANQAVNIPGMYDPVLLARLSEHLFEVQTARYWIRYPCSVFREGIAFTPPALPAHVSVNLETVTGAPSNEEIIKVQEAIRSYQQFSNVPSLFDPNINMDLSQHLFDIQMSRYMQRMSQSQSSPIVHGIARPSGPEVAERGNAPDEIAVVTNNAGTGAEADVGYDVSQPIGIHEVMERNNRLVEHANILMERSNQLVERSNQLIEEPHRPSEQSNTITEILNKLLEHSNEISKQFNKPIEQLGEALGRINKVLVGIQHAIVRNRKGNTIYAVDCLINEKGETLAETEILGTRSFQSVSEIYRSQGGKLRSPIIIDGSAFDAYIPDGWLGRLLSFYGIGENLWENKSARLLKGGREGTARIELSNYLSSCLG